MSIWVSLGGLGQRLGPAGKVVKQQQKEDGGENIYIEYSISNKKRANSHPNAIKIREDATRKEGHEGGSEAAKGFSSK